MSLAARGAQTDHCSVTSVFIRWICLMETIAAARRCQKQVKLRMHPVLDGGESVTHIASDLLLIEYHIYINYLKKRCVSYWLIQFTKLPPCICTGLAGYIVLHLCCYTFFFLILFWQDLEIIHRYLYHIVAWCESWWLSGFNFITRFLPHWYPNYVLLIWRQCLGKYFDWPCSIIF